ALRDCNCGPFRPTSGPGGSTSDTASSPSRPRTATTRKAHRTSGTSGHTHTRRHDASGTSSQGGIGRSLGCFWPSTHHRLGQRLGEVSEGGDLSMLRADGREAKEHILTAVAGGPSRWADSCAIDDEATEEAEGDKGPGHGCETDDRI